MATHTIAPIEPGSIAGLQPEFIRDRDVKTLFGLGRGTLRNLHRQGRIKGVLLRVTGSRLGVRLWSTQSIRALIQSEMNAANGE